jgi:hypothetical protein
MRYQIYHTSRIFNGGYDTRSEGALAGYASIPDAQDALDKMRRCAPEHYTEQLSIGEMLNVTDADLA